MTVRQYIGARYVPKYADPIDYQINKPYEPLTIVKYNNALYTSKKSVPAGVNPSNGEYWVYSSDFTGEVSYIMEQIGRNFDLTQNNYKNVILIGDSYGTSDGGGTTITNTLPDVIKSYGEFGNDNFRAAFANGAGFGNGAFYTLFSGVLNGMTDTEKAAVTDVYFIGGWNDEANRVSNAQFLTGVGNCETAINNNLPNARKHVIVVSNSSVNSYANLVTTFGWYDGLVTRGWDSEPNIRYTLNNFNYYVSDGSHPNQNGVNALARYITQFILNGSTDVYERYTFGASDITAAENTSNNGGSINLYFIFTTANSLTLGKVYSANNNFKVSFSGSAKSMVCNGEVMEIASVEKKFHGYTENCIIPANVRIYQDDGTMWDGDSAIVFLNNKIYYKKPLIYNDALNNVRTLTDVNCIVIGSSEGTFESLYF